MKKYVVKGNICYSRSIDELHIVENGYAICENGNVKPILTPRFIPTCSDQLMRKLSVLQKKYNLPV